MFKTIVLSQSLTNHLLKLAHDEMGHNSSTRTHMLLKRLYFWKGLEAVVHKYI